MLAELGLHYCVLLIDITKDDQFRPEFPKISPNDRIPAIIDHDGPVRRGFPISETEAILLAEKTGNLLPGGRTMTIGVGTDRS